MKTRKSGIVKSCFFAACLIVILTGLTCVSAMAASEEVTIREGVYRVKAINGNSGGQYLTYSAKSDRDKKLQFHSF